MNTRPLSVAVRRGAGWVPQIRPRAELLAQNISSLLGEADGVVWLGSDNGLYRYAGSLSGAGPALQAPLLARVTVGGNRLLFGGAPGAVPEAAELPFDVRRLRIEVSPLSFVPGLRYQTRLDPVDPGWGTSGVEPFTELTRLPPGSYTFRVRTMAPAGEASPETAWSFRVLPPWYMTPWAVVLWLGLAVAGVLGYASLRSRALQHRAARLEALVAEQTDELQRKVWELGRTQADLEAANARLQELSLQDELTGIANRRHLQRVLEEEWSRARRHRLPIAFILLDLDHFKLLNDTRGHQEGDICLRQVAGRLAAGVRLAGDLVARYGGEEFAVLLPDTDSAGAQNLAEELRRSLEQLALPHDAAPEGRVTASFGTAAMVPAPGQSAEELIETADLALYRAKAEGRNRVCTGGIESRPAPPAPPTREALNK
jgi:diguanylate cyclase (GGDEF)-like protein